MLQKTFEIATKQEAEQVVKDLLLLPEKFRNGEIVLQVFVFSFPYEETERILKPIYDAFPEIVVSGLTVYMSKAPAEGTEMPVFADQPLIRLGFFFFERAKVKLCFFDLEKTGQEEMLASVRETIRKTPAVKGVSVTIAGLNRNISPMLEELTAGFEEIPFFGTLAEVYYVSAEQHGRPYIFDSKRQYENAVIFLLYTGEDLFVDTRYIFGWKPIGKAMPITVSKRPIETGDTALDSIDGCTPEEIYKRYLGIRFDEYLTINCCEFPLVVERDGLLIGRTPYACTKEGEIVFVGSIRPEEKVRFTYTVRRDLLAETERKSCEMLSFSPQALELYVCGNRAIMLREDAHLETECFRRLAPEVLHCSAGGEIYCHRGKGGFLNSALVAVAFREGEAKPSSAEKICSLIRPSEAEGIIPLAARISVFLQAMSRDLVEYANEARRASEAKSAFLANMSHEIRTPINAVLGMDEMILRESEEPEILSYAGDIQSAGNTLLSIINDILDFSKVEEGKMEILPSQYDLSSVINDLVNMIRPRAEKKGLFFTVKVDENTPHLLFGDEIRIRQCALNILTNAVKYTEEGSVEFSVSYEKAEDKTIFLRIRVKDTGIGMKEEDMERLFSPFERIEEERNRSVEGTGLGMSITKQLLNLMGSRLEVESVYGSGSDFSFAVEQEVVDQKGIGSFAGRFETEKEKESYRELFHAPDARILMVDDTEMNLTVMHGLLKKTGIRIDDALSGREALALSGKNDYDVLFIDHMMPDMDGIETLRRIREKDRNSDVPAVALTANAISGAREMYLNAGFDDYLSKPIDGERLEKLLMDLLPKEKLLMGEKEAALPLVREDNERPRVLVVDDDETICTLVKHVLEPAYSVQECSRGTEAQKAAEEFQPDLVLLDIHLPDGNGFSLMQEMKRAKNTKEIPVLLITGDNDDVTEENGFKSGAEDYIRKPFAPDVLKQRVKRIIDLHHYQRSIEEEVERQTKRSRRLSREMMKALSKTVDTKDHYTVGHSMRVAAISAEIGRRLGKSDEEQIRLYAIGLLHDIGKIGIHDDIIHKNSRLTVDEFGVVKEHTLKGYEILKEIQDYPKLKAGARWHHERYDGTGYPDGLKGEEIPEEARIACVADCYDAMTSTRTYSVPRKQSDVRAEIERCRGTWFDPKIADVLLQMIDEDKDYRMNENATADDVWKEYFRLWEKMALDEIPIENLRKQGKETPEESVKDLPQWLLSIPEVDTKAGLKNCGSVEGYLSVLNVFLKTAEPKADEIENLYNEGDLENYTIKVHALKSSARIIGAGDLSRQAMMLEEAGKAKNRAVIEENTGKLLQDYRKLRQDLSGLEEEEEDLPGIGEEKLREAYMTAAEIAESMDYGLMDEFLKSLHAYRLPPEDAKKISKMEMMLTELDWEGIGKLAGSMI